MYLDEEKAWNDFGCAAQMDWINETVTCVRIEHRIVNTILT